MKDTLIMTTMLTTVILMFAVILAVIINWIGAINIMGQIVLVIVFTLILFIILYSEINNS